MKHKKNLREQIAKKGVQSKAFLKLRRHRRGRGIFDSISNFFKDRWNQTKRFAQEQSDKAKQYVSQQTNRQFGGLFGTYYTKYTRDTLEKFANQRIINWQLERTPIPQKINELVVIADKGRPPGPYETYFHLYSVFTLESGQQLVVEKNETINIQGHNDSKAHIEERAGAEKLNLGAAPAGLTLGQAMENCRNAMGPLFFSYDAFQNNCQDFQLGLLRSNGMLSPQATAFVKQDVSAVAKNLPPAITEFARGAVETAGFLRRAREMVGGRRTKKRSQRK